MSFLKDKKHRCKHQCSVRRRPWGQICIAVVDLVVRSHQARHYCIRGLKTVNYAQPIAVNAWTGEKIAVAIIYVSGIYVIADSNKCGLLCQPIR